MKTTVRAVRSTRKNCKVRWCGCHRGNRKLGAHLTCERVPAKGAPAVVIFRGQDVDGTRFAYMRAYDTATRTWSGELPLPDEPPRSYAPAVQRARRFVGAGVLAR